jgi:hypothetical protein
MSPNAPRLRRAVVASTVAAGLGLLGLSVSGFAAMDAQLRVAAEQTAPSRLVQEQVPHEVGPEGQCLKDGRPADVPSPEV